MPTSDFLSVAQNKNLEYFKQNLAEFLENKILANKYIVIHDEQIKGSFDDFESALDYAVLSLPKGEFIIQQVINEDEIVSFIRRAV